MRILAFSPFDPDSVSGNAVTLRRIRDGMKKRGHLFFITTISPTTLKEEARQAARELNPDVVHFYHGYKTGRLLPALSAFPSVLTLSGTDIHEDLEHPERKAEVEAALSQARVKVTYSPSIAERVPGTRVIPKGVTLGSAEFDLRAAAGLNADDFILFHAGGIRPVKNTLFAVDALAPLQKSTPSIHLVFSGPVLDAPYGHEFARRVTSEPWLRHLPQIPFEAMHAAYRSSDIVLNTSVSEGISNVLLEALASGAAVLASDIPGNRDVIRHGLTGLLYHGREDFQDKAALLFRDAERRRALGAAVRDHAKAAFSTEKELDALLSAYNDALR